MGKLNCLPQFPICFTIELISSDKYSTILIAGAENDAISWYSLIRINFNDMTNFHIFAEYLSSARLFNKSINLIISLIISFLPIEIIIGFLQQGEAKDKNQRCNICKQETNLQHINKLTQSNEKEEHVKKVSELMIQN